MGRRFGRLRRSRDGSGGTPLHARPDAEHTVWSSMCSKVPIEKTPEAWIHSSPFAAAVSNVSGGANTVRSAQRPIGFE
jgi:hypothetical protein